MIYDNRGKNTYFISTKYSNCPYIITYMHIYIYILLISYCTVLDFIRGCLFCFYFDEALAESK